MRVRKRWLPPGWYPESADQTMRAIAAMTIPQSPAAATGVAGIVPHAGWEYSGSLALEVLSRISPTIDTIVIIGGHLGQADRIVCAQEDAYLTPLGLLSADMELMARIGSRVPMREDRSADNSVEVQLPFVRHLFPSAMALALRAPPSRDAAILGTAIARAADDLGRRVAVAGSTDLTHYGTTYGWSPAGQGEAGLRWVRETNDHRIIESLLAMDFDGALDRALRERSACSAGGALAAMTYAAERGATRGTMVRYATSYDVHPAESFVGYAGILYC